MNLKETEKVNIALIGGTGLETPFKQSKIICIGTPYGFPQPISIGEIDGKTVAFLPRHGINHSIPPHKVNYRANIYALHKIGVERIIATNAVGAINLNFKPGDLVIPHDLIDFTKQRKFTYYDDAPVTHINFSKPYCPEIRKILIEKSREESPQVWDEAVYVCTEGPRFETPAEIRMFKRLGCDVVGMTGIPEAVLARELEMCYATICFVSNMAAGIKEKLSSLEVMEKSKDIMPIIQQILIETIKNLPKDRRCPCAVSLKEARI